MNDLIWCIIDPAPVWLEKPALVIVHPNGGVCGVQRLVAAWLGKRRQVAALHIWWAER